jgi:hypothetical protein
MIIECIDYKLSQQFARGSARLVSFVRASTEFVGGSSSFVTSLRNLGFMVIFSAERLMTGIDVYVISSIAGPQMIAFRNDELCS